MPLWGRLVLVVLLVAVPVFAIQVLQRLDQREAGRRLIAERAEVAAGQSAARADRPITAARFLLTAIARLKDVRTLDSAECQDQLHEIVTQLPEVVGLAVLSPDGATRCSSTGSRVNLSDRDYFRATLETRSFQASGFIVGRVTGRGSMVFTYPALTGDRIDFVVLLAISTDALSANLADDSLPEGSFIMVADARARILAYWPNAEKWVGRDLSETDWARVLPDVRRRAVLANLAGELGAEYALGYAPLAAPSQATVIAGLPVGPALRELDALFWRSILLTALVFLAAIAIVAAGAALLVQRPIRQLTAQVDALAIGHPSPATMSRGLPELQRLSEHFRRMSDALAARESDLKEALQQKEMLVKETNHRVKNSLQLIASLFSLERSRIADPKVRAHFEEASQRVNTVARIHQQLYQDSHFDSVAFDALLKELCQELQQGLGRPGGPRLECDADACRVPTDKAVPLALIVNELVTNAFKYAYPDSVGGMIRVECRHNGKDLVVEVSDDGVPLPLDFDPARGKGLGMQMLSALVKQLRGRTEVVARPDGKSFVLRVPHEARADA